MITKETGLGYDVSEAVAKLCDCDRMAAVVDRVGPCRLVANKRLSLFAAMMRSITYQQLSGNAAGAIWRRTCGLYPNSRPRPELVAETDYERLRKVGLSNAKTRAIKDLAEKTIDGTLPSRRLMKTMEDEAVIDALTHVRGVGRWTAEMILIFYLGRPDVFPVGDLGVRKGVTVTYGLDRLLDPDELEPYGDRWRPFRSVGSWYMWRVLDIEVME